MINRFFNSLAAHGPSSSSSPTLGTCNLELCEKLSKKFRFASFIIPFTAVGCTSVVVDHHWWWLRGPFSFLCQFIYICIFSWPIFSRGGRALSAKREDDREFGIIPIRIYLFSPISHGERRERPPQPLSTHRTRRIGRPTECHKSRHKSNSLLFFLCCLAGSLLGPSLFVS